MDVCESITLILFVGWASYQAYISYDASIGDIKPSQVCAVGSDSRTQTQSNNVQNKKLQFNKLNIFTWIKKKYHFWVGGFSLMDFFFRNYVSNQKAQDFTICYGQEYCI